MSFDLLYGKGDLYQGVLPGGLHDTEQIKVLICYLLCETGESVTSDFMCGVLQKCGTANYFEASQSFSELVANGQLVKSEDSENCYKIADSGAFVVSNLADELPAAAKESTLKSFKNFLRQYDIKQENSVDLMNRGGKNYIECTVNDGDNPLLKINMYVPNTEQASLVRNVFYNNTDTVYQAVVALMTGDKRTAVQIIQSAELNTDDFI